MNLVQNLKDNKINNMGRNILLPVHVFLISSWIAVIHGLCQEIPKEGTEIIYGKRYSDGDLLTCKVNIGLNMCIETCAKTTGCAYVNYDSNMLFCELLEYNVEARMSYLQTKHGNILAVMSNLSDVCDSNVCQSGFTCLQTSGGKSACVPIDRQCCEDRFLVTGQYGVGSDRVTFSSVYGPAYFTYPLDSTVGWAALYLNTDQWIQVLFQSRKIVVGVVTQGRQGNSQWVSSYQVKYKDHDGDWVYLKDKSGVIVTFPGNSGSDNRKINYFSSPLSTNGIQLRPQTWSNWMTLRFDILGC